MAPQVSKKKTGQFTKMGQTASAFGSDPSMTAKGQAGETPRELNP